MMKLISLKWNRCPQWIQEIIHELKTLDKSALANEQFRALAGQQLFKQLIPKGHQERGREVGAGAEGRWTETQMSREYHGKDCMEKQKMTLVKLTPDHVGQNTHFGIPGCDTRTCSPETGSVNHARCLLLLYLWATFNHTWLVPSVFKPDHETISWGMHKAALNSVEHDKHLLICIMCQDQVDTDHDNITCRLLVRRCSSTWCILAFYF